MYYLLLTLDRTSYGSDLLLLVCTILCLMSRFPAVETTTAFGKFSPFLVSEFLECSSRSWGSLSETRCIVLCTRCGLGVARSWGKLLRTQFLSIFSFAANDHRSELVLD